jgi:hypothetical protein
MLAGYFCQASAPWGAMSTAAIISFRRRLFIEVEMCPVHIFDIREAKIGKEIHDLWGRIVPPQGVWTPGLSGGGGRQVRKYRLGE